VRLRACCNNVGGPILAGEGKGIGLAGFGRRGDESRLCCNLVVADQTVIAQGKLVPFPDVLGPFPTHMLEDARRRQPPIKSRSDPPRRASVDVQKALAILEGPGRAP
jgi:hypothetical protein